MERKKSTSDPEKSELSVHNYSDFNEDNLLLSEQFRLSEMEHADNLANMSFEESIKTKIIHLETRMGIIEQYFKWHMTRDSQKAVSKDVVTEYAFELLRQGPYPKEKDLEGVSLQIREAFPQESLAQISSKVREWFRKRREYMTHRINTVCMNYLKDRREEEFKQKIMASNQAVEEVFGHCKFEIENEEERNKFIRDKVINFYESKKRRSPDMSLG